MDSLTKIKIKICGITNIEDAATAVELGADALGFIFYSGSKRFVDPAAARDIILKLPPFITSVGVFVNQDLDEIKRILDITGVNTVQLHGDESQEFCGSVTASVPAKVIKAIRVKDSLDAGSLAQYPVQAILLDTYSDAEYGGTGKSFDWGILKDIDIEQKVILSGGLSPDNVAQAVEAVKPYAVDVNSGVEAGPGKKDHEKLKKFIEAIRYGNKNNPS